MTMSLLLVPLAGCVSVSTECDWTRPIMFNDETTINWLLSNDRDLLENVVAHNETRERICK
jgi:hypothetical protein